MEDSEKSENPESKKRSREVKEDEDDDNEKGKVADASEASAKRPNNQATVYFKVLVPSTAAGAIIGKGGETINQLQADTATNIKMSKGGDFFPGTTDRVCMIIGSVENIQKVYAFVLEKIKEKPDSSAGATPGESKAKIVVPNSTASLIIGKNGDNIKTIKELTDIFIQVSPKSTNTEKPLSERIITISGDPLGCDKAVNLILEKIVEDPQSGTCTNVSYTDGPILPQNSVASLFSTNLTSSLHLPVTGHPTMEALKFILRAKGYNEPATREITAAMYTLASYGFLVLRPPALPTMNQEWPSTSSESTAAAPSDYYGQGTDTATNTGNTATNTNQTQDQNNYASYYANYYNTGGNYGNNYNMGGNYGNGYNTGGNYDNSADYYNAGYNNFGNRAAQGGTQDASNYSTAAPSSGFPTSTGDYSTGGANYSATPGSYSMAGGGYPGGMGDYGTGGSSAPPSNDMSMSVTRQEVDIGEHVLQAMMGQEGKGIMEIQQWFGVTIEVAQKAPFMHTVKIMGTLNAVQSALYCVQQYVQHAEYKRYYEGQTAQQGSHQ